MPSSPYPARKVDVEGRDPDSVDNRARKRSVKFEEDVKPVVDLEEVEDCKPAEKVRRAGVRSSSRIATLASRTPVKQEAPELSPSPQRIRKKVKVTVKETKVTVKKVKAVKKEVKNEEVKKEGSAPVKGESDGDPPSGDTDDLGEVAEEVNRSSTDQLGQKLQQQLADRAGLSDAMQVKATIRIFNFLYLEAIQLEDKRATEHLIKIGEAGTGKRPSKRPDLKAISKMLEQKATLNPEKKIGNIPGVEVGQQFLSRAEMVVIGLHSHWLNGIDYIGVGKAKNENGRGFSIFMPILHFRRGGMILLNLQRVGPPQFKENVQCMHSLKIENGKKESSDLEFPICVSIVMSGGYEDDVDNSEDVVYTGQGGNDLLSTKKQIKDQKMEKGNLALKNSMKCKQPIRVIRGHDDKRSYSKKVYTYDGLYEVYDHWAEKGISGFTVFKYKLRRAGGQPVLTTEQVKFSRGKVAPLSIADLRGLVCNDVSNGQEKLPVPASNTVDDPPVPPTDYTYISKTIISDNIPKPAPSKGCSCKGKCTDEAKCACARKNGGSFPYVLNHGGRLVKPMDVVYECGPGCGCGPECLNRTSQAGLQFRLEVYKTVSKGWACRSWDFIPAGSPICEYFGILRKNDENLESMVDNGYIFELDLMQTMQGMEGREKRFGDVGHVVDVHDEDDLMQDVKYVIDAGSSGSVSRFLNHSCEPNVFIQCVMSHHNDHFMPRIVMFAADNIHPLEELCYDYGFALDSVLNADGTVKPMACHCGAPSCRKRMY